jgi:NAD(P)-dependent dehydrogenase (short-subunit alcohol dehydrogenase family)
MNRFALVTGTSSGIGLAVARALLEHGWRVTGIARRKAPIDQPEYRHLALDLADADALVDQVTRHLTPLLHSTRWDRLGLVNNAALTGPLRPLRRVTTSDLLRVYAVNVAAPVWLMGYFAGHGSATPLRIVNLSSGVAKQPRPGLAAYSSSKAALLNAARALAEEWENPTRSAPAPPDASILSFEPHVVDTPMQREARAPTEKDFPWVAVFQEYYRRRALVPPEAPAAEIVEFLESKKQPRLVERRFQP